MESSKQDNHSVGRNHDRFDPLSDYFLSPIFLSLDGLAM